MNTLIITETLTPGGAEIFLMNWASYANSSGHSAFIFCMHKRLDNDSTIRVHLNNVRVYYPFSNKFIDKYLAKVDSAFKKMGLRFSIRDYRTKSRLKKLHKNLKIDIVHSHLFPADYITMKAFENQKIRHFTTIHGDYLRHYSSAKAPIAFRSKMDEILSRVSGVVCISDAQLEFFKNRVQTKTPLKKIYNGFNLNYDSGETVSNRFVFGMVSRGIKEKGWKEACLAFEKMGIDNTELWLVGTSDYMRELEREFKHNRSIKFLGYKENTIEIIKSINVGLLPSYYGSESLPTVIIEYLSQGKPVIAANIGEVKNMIEQPMSCGTLIEANQKPVDIVELSKSMKEMYVNNELRQQYAMHTKPCFEKFNIEQCVTNYMDFYRTSRTFTTADAKTEE